MNGAVVFDDEQKKIFLRNFNLEGVWLIGTPVPGPLIRASTSGPLPHTSFNQLNLLLVKIQSL